MTVTLEISVRDPKKTTNRVRADGMIPAVVYGPKQPNTSVMVERITFEKLFKTAGEATIITLKGLAKPVDVLVHDVDFNPTRGGIQHIDFYAMESGKEMTVHVPLEFVGESAIEKIGGMVSKIMHEVEVTCLPDNLPAHITVDISVLTEAEQKIHVSELAIPKGVTMVTEGTEVVALAEAGRVAEPESEPEVAEVAAAIAE